VSWTAIAAIGLAVGLLAGLFGKGGSAVATPLLHLVGVPAIVAVAAPLPATIPSTLAGTAAYWKAQALDRQVVVWSVALGIPATIVGAWASRWVSGNALLTVTDVAIAAIGVRTLIATSRNDGPPAGVAGYRTRLAAVAVGVGVVSGLLANSGGFLLAPLYLLVLRRPIRTSFACSLAVAAVLAVPGTIVHWALGHIDWRVAAVFASTSIPTSYLGASLALRMKSDVLERGYGAGLALMGVGLLLVRG
jgi:uncharacterized membrane protein YfcA